MGLLSIISRPHQLPYIVQWKLFREPVHKRDQSSECDSLKVCFYYLDQTSRSFVAVIKELHRELLVPVSLFYLVLRALDTVEDDPTLDVSTKEPLLRDFHSILDKDGWTFDGNGPHEKDRALLVDFDKVIIELKKIRRPYFDVICDIANKMGNGMADFIVLNDRDPDHVQTVADYERYCHIVAGLVGEGATRLFIEAKLADKTISDRPHLSESMGQFLQKNNIIRDVREDWDEQRRWWPREVWSKYVDQWDDIFDPVNREKAMQCVSELVLNALSNVEDCIMYISGIHEQSVFNFVAIPQTMAIATLELCFRNPAIFDRNVKISKGKACQIMLQSTQGHKAVCEVFRCYARRIHKKNDPRDPNYLPISVQCAKIEQFIERMYPSQTPEKSGAAAGLDNGNEAGIGPFSLSFVLGGFFIAIITAWFLG